MQALLPVWPVVASLAGFFLALAGLMVGLFRWLRSDIRRLGDRMGWVEREVAGVKAEVGALKVEVGALKVEVGALKADVGALKADVGALKDDSNFIKGKLSFMESYILRRNDPAPAPGE